MAEIVWFNGVRATIEERKTDEFALINIEGKRRWIAVSELDF